MRSECVYGSPTGVPQRRLPVQESPFLVRSSVKNHLRLRRVAAVSVAGALLALSACAPDLGVIGDPPPVQTPTTTGVPTSPAPSPSPSEEPTPTPTLTPTPSPTPSEPPVVTPTPSALHSEGDSGDDIRELQHRLAQLEWFEGKITGDYETATRLAVEGFQGKRTLPATGEVDQATWDVLVKMTREPTHDEMYNIMRPGPTLLAEGATGDSVKDLQARLKQIAWYEAKIDGIYGAKTVEAVRGFQAKREIPVTGEVDQRTLDRLKAMTRRPTTDELNNVAPKPGTMSLDDRCLSGRVVCISKAQRKLAWVVDGEIQMTMDVRFGSELTPTRNGVFSVYWKSRNHVSKLYGSAMPWAMFFSGGQAVHYSADFAARGYNGSSHGCVNVRSKERIDALYSQVREGDTVVVYSG